MGKSNIEKAKYELKEFRKGYGQSQLNDDCIIQLMLLHSSFRNEELLSQRYELLELLKTFTICMDLGETENLENCCKTSKELIIKIEKCKIK